MSLLAQKDGTGGKDWGLGGEFLQPREVATLAYKAGIHDAIELAICVAVCKAESQYGIKAWHDNLVDNVVVSRDVGLWQINIPAEQIGTQVERDLYVPEHNAAAMVALHARRRWQPWAAFNSGVYLHDHYSGYAALALCNFAVASFNQSEIVLPLPLFSTRELRAKLT